MKSKIINIDNIELFNIKYFVLFGGMNVFEFWDLVMWIVEYYVNVIEKLEIFFVFKVLFDKVNCFFIYFYCGFGMDEGLKIFEEIKLIFNVFFIIDVYELY